MKPTQTTATRQLADAGLRHCYDQPVRYDCRSPKGRLGNQFKAYGKIAYEQKLGRN